MALVIVLQMFCGSINIANLITLNFSLIPIVLGAIVLGPVAGALLGFANGIVILIQVILTPSGFYYIIWTYSPVITTLICIVKTTVAGFVGGIVFRLISKKNTLAATFTAAAIVPVINTALFILGCLCMTDTILIYQDTRPDYDGMNIFIFICVGIVTVNFFIEFALNLIVSPALNSVYRVVEKQFNNKKTVANNKNQEKNMIICLDVGNTNIKYAVFDGEELVISFRVATDVKKTSDEYGGQLLTILSNNGVNAADIRGGIISSVVPQMDYTLERMCATYLHIKPLTLAPGLKTGLNMRVDNVREVGADRVVNNVAGLKKYGAPLIIIDFGTATTFNVLDEKGEFIGGVIAPGIKGSLDSLVNGTAKLPRVEIERPSSVIAKNTVTNMQAGIVFGFAGLVGYIVKKIKKELKSPDIKTVATGGFSEVIAKEIDCIDCVDKLLTLDGLKYLYYLNSTEA